MYRGSITLALCKIQRWFFPKKICCRHIFHLARVKWLALDINRLGFFATRQKNFFLRAGMERHRHIQDTLRADDLHEAARLGIETAIELRMNSVREAHLAHERFVYCRGTLNLPAKDFHGFGADDRACKADRITAHIPKAPPTLGFIEAIVARAGQPEGECALDQLKPAQCAALNSLFDLRHLRVVAIHKG